MDFGGFIEQQKNFPYNPTNEKHCPTSRRSQCGQNKFRKPIHVGERNFFTYLLRLPRTDVDSRSTGFGCETLY